MRAGKQRNKLTLQTKTLTADGAGGSSVVWADTNTFWGKFRVLSATEQLGMDRDEAKMTREICMRYQTGVTPGNRIKYGTRLFDIHSVENVDERNAEIRLSVVEIIA